MRRAPWVAALVLVALAVAAAEVLWPSSEPEAGQPIVYSATAFKSHRPTSTRALRGHPVLLTSWATWCTECRYELPKLEQFWQQERGRGLRVVAVNVDTTGGVGPAGRAAAEFGLTMPIWSDRVNRFTTLFGGVGVPMSVLLDRRGRLVRVWYGPLDFADAAKTQPITDLLAGRGRSPE